MRNYVINLTSATARLQHMKAEFSRLGLSFERFEAVDGRTLPFPLPARKDREWAAGEYGCYLSHLAVWKLVAAGPDPFCAVFEDDLLLDDRIADVLAAPLPSDAEIVKLETVRRSVYLSRHAVRTPRSTELRRLLSGHHGAAAYILSREAAIRLVHDTSAAPSDDLLFGTAAVKRFCVYQMCPGLAVQSAVAPEAMRRPALASTLQEGRQNTRQHIVNAASRSRWRRLFARIRRAARWLQGRRAVIVPFGLE